MPSRDITTAAIRLLVRPPCPRCGGRMMLRHITPQTPGYEVRTFECPSCGYSTGEVVKLPPIEP
jgi:predicted RNA-binding Zn-ribbon protein involved in translation (DUF1610 family)